MQILRIYWSQPLIYMDKDNLDVSVKLCNKWHHRLDTEHHFN